MFILSVAFVLAFAVGCLLVSTQRWHLRWSADDPVHGPQKLHHATIPRIGGCAIFLGFLPAVLLAHHDIPMGSGSLRTSTVLLLALGLSFGFGLAEDVSKRVGPWIRLMATFAAAWIAFLGAGTLIAKFDFPLLDDLLQAHWLLALLLTLFSVGAISHAFNLSDGLNGLLGGLSLLALGLIGAAALAVGDVFVLNWVLALAGATAGFLVWNYPRARLFAGDSGAYLLGTAIALLAIIFAARNPQVSPWLCLMAVIYPFTDTSFAIVRRIWQKRGIMQPDAEHLHSLLVRALQPTWGARCNPLATLIILLSLVPFLLLAYRFSMDTHALQLLAGSCFVTYILSWTLLQHRLKLRVARWATEPMAD